MRVGAVEHREIFPRFAFRVQLVDLLRDPMRFRFLRDEFRDADARAFLLFGCQLVAPRRVLLILVLLDHLAGARRILGVER